MADVVGLGTAGLVIVLIVVGVRAWGRLERRGLEGPRREERARRSGGNALLVLEEFIAPRVEHVIEARRERLEEDDQAGPGDGESEVTEASVLGDLRVSLGRSPIDPEEVRRHLASAQRAGHDWRRLFDEAIRAELAAWPYRAPALPPMARVAPRD
jgi:hypothetical protein